MTTLNELFKEFSGKTSLQKAEHLKRRVGVEFEIVAELGNIDTDHLRCWNFKPEVSSSNSIHIMHTGERLRKQLLEYSHGDVVRMSTQFVGAEFDYDSNRWTFDLVSIVRLCTREAKAKRIDKANLRWARVAGVIGLLYGAVSGFVAGVILCILLVNIVLPVINWKYELGSWTNERSWPIVVTSILTLGGSIIGCWTYFADERKNRF